VSSPCSWPGHRHDSVPGRACWSPVIRTGGCTFLLYWSRPLGLLCTVPPQITATWPRAGPGLPDTGRPVRVRGCRAACLRCGTSRPATRVHQPGRVLVEVREQLLAEDRAMVHAFQGHGRGGARPSWRSSTRTGSRSLASFSNFGVKAWQADGESSHDEPTARAPCLAADRRSSCLAQRSTRRVWPCP
jgi:hypothetical protein